MNLKIISAGAGSGKTYRLTSEMVDMLQQRDAAGNRLIRASGIIATTFTNKAAAELKERVRIRLLENGMAEEAADLGNAVIGTVHSLGVNLLKRFAYEAGVSPEVDILADENRQIMFNQSLATVLTTERVEKMENLSSRLGLNKKGNYDWRKDVREVTEIARSNNFSKEKLEESKILSFETFKEFLDEPTGDSRTEIHNKLASHIEEAILTLTANEDSTKVTGNAVEELRSLAHELRTRKELYWHSWAKISKIKVGAKSRDDIQPLVDFSKTHTSCPDFQQDIRLFITHIFDFAIAAIEEYGRYKLQRGLIDFIDMEATLNKLLDEPGVNEVLSQELDLLMVDEFQDTSPIQLEIFLKLSKLAKFSVWVGDPKQSIYGFRGADPELMKAIIDRSGGIRPENIQEYSWRSREDIVNTTNAIFTRAFEDMPPEQVRLIARRKNSAEPNEMNPAVLHWHFQTDPDTSRMPGSPWFENCITEMLRLELGRGHFTVVDKTGASREARAGDVAILCRTNYHCQLIAEALHRAGLKAAIARTGLLNTAEAKLILACLKYILNKNDSLSVAEILLLASQWTTAEIIENRLEYLESAEEINPIGDNWASNVPVIALLDDLREKVVELSSAEILNLLLEEMDLRRLIAGWGKKEQRLGNVDVLCNFAHSYEEGCNRLHTAASLGGFLLWLYDLEAKGQDFQGSGESTDAVNVLTYHKSKGLEYPVTICYGLENDLRGEVWGSTIVPEKEEIDLDNLLGNRWLRYWVNPYGDQVKGTSVYEKIAESEAQLTASVQARKEETRLLYVGITRARDYLIFTSRQGKPAKWLNRVCTGVDDHAILDPYVTASPWVWEEKEIPVNTKTEVFGKDFQIAPFSEETISFIEPPAGKLRHLPYYIQPEKEHLNLLFKASTGDKFRYAPPIHLPQESNFIQVEKAFKAFLLADSLHYKEERRLKMAENLIQRFEITESVNADIFLKNSGVFFRFLDLNFPYKKISLYYRLTGTLENRHFIVMIDFLLETEKEFILVKFSPPSAHDADNPNRAALDLSPWFFLALHSFRQLHDSKPVRTLCHFPLKGELIEVEIERN